MKTSVKQTINKVTSLLEVKYIYRSTTRTGEHDKSLYIIILKGNCTSLTLELSTMAAKIFQEESDVLYRIFSFEYACQQVSAQNLFFIDRCSPSSLIYKSPDAEGELINLTIDDKVITNIRAGFKRECDKINSFMDGAIFFLKKENYPQAAFMLHQCIELWYRYASLFIMGKERKSHSIKELQTYIRIFVPELGILFHTEIEEERHLLKQLDEAYVNARYGNNYHINRDQIIKIKEKTNAVKKKVVQLFEERCEACEEFFAPQRTFLKESSKLPTDETDQPDSLMNESKIFATLKAYIGEHYYLLKQDRRRKERYHLHIQTKGYLDTSFMISSLLKVCFLALDTEYMPNHIVQDSGYNVKEVLGYVLQMIPHEEMDFLDKVRELLTATEAKENTD
ncbi:HEPN domain-containing protein [Zhouia spongiae]|uniref:HEPN domain-containing protein n=1 Tax=Zhouia spongiae TaxID=2202721 RepID=A0ABY3YJP6_9FLAO|nr:HEPN domain-containing protein [Zhouia spongiae]UNY97871.1 HEPN domain-containing protein [Zhouia spongiae]